VPDLAAVADNLAVYFQGSWGAVGGISAAAPIWAVNQALVNEDTMQRLSTFSYSPRFYYAVADKDTTSTLYLSEERRQRM
jgi:subtilase family serine protease